MARITDQAVTEANDQIARAKTTYQAFLLIGTLSRTMVDRLLDLNGIDVDGLTGYGRSGRGDMLAGLLGWDWNERGDNVPADGRGLAACWLGRFESHSRRPLQCRACGRRKLDHRPVS
jgi:hypothetical protein